MREYLHRVRRLEGAATAQSAVGCWTRIIQKIGETTEDAIARSFPTGVPEGSQLIVRRIVSNHMEAMS